MKWFILVSFFLTSYVEAAKLHCSQIAALKEEENVFEALTEFQCYDKNGESYELKMHGFGIQIDTSMNSDNATMQLFLSCPTVRLKNIEGTYRGIDLEAGIFLQGKLSLMAGKRSAPCFIFGRELAHWGATVVKLEAKATKMVIKKLNDNYDFIEYVRE